MKEVISKGSIIAKELENMVSKLEGSDDVLAQYGSMFDAEHLADAKEDIVGRILAPSKYVKKFSVRDMILVAIRERWLKVLEDWVINKNYLAVDNEMNLKSLIVAIIVVEGTRLVCKFRYVSMPQLKKIQERGPMANHVLSMNAECYMVHCFDGLIFYQHGQQCKVFHVNYSERFLDAVRKRCRALNDYVLLGGIPSAKGDANGG
jgi:hypothetical protein